MTDIVPATGGAVTPATPAATPAPVFPASPPTGPVTPPSAPTSNLPATVGGGQTPAVGNGASRESLRPAGTGLAHNLSAFSVLDLIVERMTLLNGDLTHLVGLLEILSKTADALDATITNVDELGRVVEAPVATRSALDAASAIGAHLADLVATAGDHATTVQMCNAAAFLATKVVREVQDNQRIMGAGPKLLATAGS